MGKNHVGYTKKQSREAFLHWLDVLRESVDEGKLVPEGFTWTVGLEEKLKGVVLTKRPDGHESYEFNVYRPATGEEANKQ